MKVQIISPAGKKGYVPIDNIGKAIERGFQIVPGGNVTPIIENNIPVPQQNKIRVMSPEGKFGYIDTQKLESAVSRGFKPAPASGIEPPAKESWAGLIGKSALKVPMSLLDIPKAAVGLAETTQNNPRGIPLPYGGFIDDPDVPRGNIDIASKIPGSDAAREFIQDKTGIDLMPRPEGAAQRIVGNAVEWATPLGVAGKGANLANRATQSARLAATGAGIGTTSGVLQEVGVDPLVADIGSSIAAPNPANLLKNFSKIKENAPKLPLKIMGLGPKSFNLKAAEAAKNLGVDLPATVFTDSTLTGLADQWIGKVPFYGNRLKNKYAKAEEQIYRNLEDTVDRIGPKATPEVEAESSRLYKIAENALPDTILMNPKNTMKAVKEIKINSPIASDDEFKVRKKLSEIKKEITKKPLPSTILDQYGQPIQMDPKGFMVNRLVAAKRSLNSIIKFDQKEEGVKQLLEKLRGAISKDLDEYGKIDPEWYGLYKEAEKFHGQKEARRKIEDLLIDKPTNSATDTLSFNALSKAINAPKNRRILEKQTDPETLAKIKDIGKVAKAISVKNKNIPNPSGTAMTAATIGLAGSLLANPLGTLSFSGLGAVVGAHTATKLLTDKKIIDMAIEMAQKQKKPELPKIAAFNKRVKDLTGYSTVTLMRNMDNDEQTEGLDYGL